MNPTSEVNAEVKIEAAVQQELVATPEAQKILRQRALRRGLSATYLLTALIVFLVWLPSTYRSLLLQGLIANRLLVTLILLFGLMAVSLLWSVGQRLDVWVFKAFNLRGYHSALMDRLMWFSTQIGNFVFATAVIVIAYVLGERNFAIGAMLGSLTLLLFVTVLKAITDRARPFNLMRETHVVGFREPGLSFPSGHTAQTFFMMTFAVRHFELPFLAAVILYGLALLVGFTRVYLGVHYPRDVIAGALLGLLWGTLLALIAPYL